MIQLQRQIATESSTAKSTRIPEAHNQIVQLALNQPTKPKSKPASSSSTINTVEVDKNKKDVQTLNSDLQLLSSLLGRPLSQNDIPQLTKQLTIAAPAVELSFPGSSSISIPSTTKSAPSLSTAANGATLTREAELLQKIIQKQSFTANELSKNESSTNDDNKIFSDIDPAEAYGKTNDALLATLLKQRGIGPAHNNIPADLYPSSTTTASSPLQLSEPKRPGRPILDGLSWLWQTWQDTAPGTHGYQSQAVRTRTRGLATTNDATAAAATDTGATNAELNFDDGLDSDIASVILLF